MVELEAAVALLLTASAVVRLLVEAAWVLRTASAGPLEVPAEEPLLVEGAWVLVLLTASAEELPAVLVSELPAAMVLLPAAVP